MRQRAGQKDGGHSTIYCPKRAHTPEDHSLRRGKGEQNTDFLREKFLPFLGLHAEAWGPASSASSSAMLTWASSSAEGEEEAGGHDAQLQGPLDTLALPHAEVGGALQPPRVIVRSG